MTPVQRYLLGSAEAALKVAQEELGRTASLQRLEDYALELMKQGRDLKPGPRTR